MLKVRDDDVLMYKGEWKDPYSRFVEVHGLIVQYGAMHVPAILMTEILDFSDVIVFIRQETLAGRMEPQWHGWKHVDYAKVEKDKIIWEIKASQNRFREWFDTQFTKFYTPWGANAPHIKEACDECGIEMVDCSDIVRCVHVNEEPEKFHSKDIEIMIHWWEGKERLNRTLKWLTRESS